MEVGVRITGVVLRLIHLLLMPLFWLINCRKTTRLPPIADPLLLESAVGLAKKIRNGVVTSEQLVKAFIKRVQEVNPYLNAVVEGRFAAALEEARRADLAIDGLRRASPAALVALEKAQPLLGVPFTVKESCSLKGLSNSVGCVELAGRRAAADGAGVARARAAGGVALLVSATPELCLGWETSSRARAATANPYGLARTPGGSSGGEAALIASGASVFGVGSDIAGSIRIPCAFTGIFGHKPTPGIIPIEGHIPTLNDKNYPKFLTIGPLVRYAEDLKLTLQILAGKNAYKLKLNEPVDMKDIKVHYMTEAVMDIALIDVDQCIKSKIRSAVDYLHKECGAQISEEKFLGLEESVEMSISGFFSMKDIPNLLLDPSNPKREKNLLLELLKCIVGLSSRSLQSLLFSLITKTKLFIPEPNREYYNKRSSQLLEQMTLQDLTVNIILNINMASTRILFRLLHYWLLPSPRGDMDNTLGDNGIFIYPAFNGQAHYHNQVFAKASGVIYSMLFNILGMPVTTVPLGLHRGLPVCVQVIAAPNQDRLCVAVAKQLEIGFGGWRPPS